MRNRALTLFDSATAKPAKIRLFIIGRNYTTWYGSVQVSSLDTIRMQRIEQMVFIPTKMQALKHRDVNLNDNDIVKLVGIKGFDAIVLDKEETH